MLTRHLKRCMYKKRLQLPQERFAFCTDIHGMFASSVLKRDTHSHITFEHYEIKQKE